MKIDIVVGLSKGDEAKSKVAHHLVRTRSYTHVLRGTGGANCGHTIYHNGKKMVTHSIPVGVFFGVRSIIGPGCLVHPPTFFEELKFLKDNGFDGINTVKIAANAHIVTEEHLAEDALDVKIGSTKRGISQAQRDRYARVGIQAKDVPELKDFIIDFYQEFFEAKTEPTVLFEGAQGMYLDIYHGDYPYVTSSHCTVAGALLNGIPHTAIRNVYGVDKAYTTYVGNKKFQPEGEIYNKLQEVGKELGSTTGRKRQCNFLDINNLRKAINVNGVTNLIINKMDVLRELNTWKMIEDGEIIDLKNEENFKNKILSLGVSTRFSYSPEEV